MPEDALSGLYRMCDCFVSLHRSEGFGFGPAEAMAHGRPAIVTNYSGVCDFCTPTTAKLVGYQLVRVKDDEYAYLDKESGLRVADPDLKMAANYMRNWPKTVSRANISAEPLVMLLLESSAFRRCAPATSAVFSNWASR